MDKVIEWQNRPFDAVYPILYLDCIVLKIRHEKRVVNKSIYLALGINIELQNRGVEQVLIACVDGLSGFPDAIHTAFPAAEIQLCIIHMVRNSLKYVSWKDYKAITADLKKIYQSAKWDNKYPSISKSWLNNWPNLVTIFDYPPDIKKAIYTTNAIESLNSVIRKSIKIRTLFLNDELAMRIIYLAIQSASKKWTMPIRN